MIGGYKKVKALYQGSLVNVWLVEEGKTGKEYVAKLISLKAMGEKLMRDEIEAHKKVDNPHLIKTIDAFKDDANNAFVIVTEYCPGSSFSHS